MAADVVEGPQFTSRAANDDQRCVTGRGGGEVPGVDQFVIGGNQQPAVAEQAPLFGREPGLAAVGLDRQQGPGAPERTCVDATKTRFPVAVSPVSMTYRFSVADMTASPFVDARRRLPSQPRQVTGRRSRDRSMVAAAKSASSLGAARLVPEGDAAARGDARPDGGNASGVPRRTTARRRPPDSGSQATNWPSSVPAVTRVTTQS